MAENNTWEKEEYLEHARELVDEFKGRQSIEVRRQEEVNPKVKEFKRMDLLGRYMVKLLYGWDDGKFEAEYLRKLERNWQRWKLVFPEEKP